MKWNFRDRRTGRFRACRISPTRLQSFCDDPMTLAYGVDTSEFVNDWRRQDLQQGCPRCRQEVLENASEPDVMQRWELR